MKKIIISMVVIAMIFFVGGMAFFITSKKSSDENTKKNLAEAKKLYESIPIWHKKIKTNQETKIGIITDTHVHPNRIDRTNKSKDAPRYLNEKYTQPLNRFVSQMQQFRPEFIVHLGDVIEGTDDEDFVGMMGLQLVKEELDKAGVPIYWVIGNHDLRSVTKEQFKKVYTLDSLDQVIDFDDYRFIVLDANYNSENLPRTPEANRYIPGKLPPQTLEWFKKQLETDKRVFVFVHQGTFLDGSQGDEGRTKQSIANSEELRDILKEYRVDAIFNGHMEARRYEEGRFTRYYSLTGTKKSETYPHSYYELVITDGVPDVTFFYAINDKAEMRSVDFESCEDSIDCGDYVVLVEDDVTE